VRLLNWPIDRLRRRARRDNAPDATTSATTTATATTTAPATATATDERPLALVRRVAERLVVVAVDEAARRAGIHPNMPLAQARALRADLLHAEHDPHADLAALKALARWMLRFTPVVGIIDDAPDSEPHRAAPSTDVSPHPRHAAMRVARFAQGERLLYDRAPARKKSQPKSGTTTTFGLALDLTGCERLFGGIEPLVRQIDDSLRRLRLSAAVCVAPTLGSAWAISFDLRRRCAVIDDRELLAALDPLPPYALRLPHDLVASLRHVGIDSVALLRAMPRAKLPARFGPLLLQRLDQALGQLPEPIVAVEPFRPIVRHVEFEYVVNSLDAVLLTLERLLDAITVELRRRGRGARNLSLALLRPRGRSATFTVALARASRDPKALLRLCRYAIETDADQLGLRRRSGQRVASRRPRAPGPRQDDAHDDPGAIEYVDDGFIGIGVSVDRSEPVIERQIDLSGQCDAALDEEYARLVERLSQKLGMARVLVASSLPAYLPEKSFRLDTALTAETTAGCASPAFAHQTEPAGSLPLTLLPMPREARVIVSPSHDRDGKPVWIDFDNDSRAIVHCLGPSRVAGEWWHGHLRTRDYFEVEDDRAARLWLFRVPENGRWFVHGFFG
jgi:protein ImuB